MFLVESRSKLKTSEQQTPVKGQGNSHEAPANFGRAAKIHKLIQENISTEQLFTMHCINWTCGRVPWKKFFFLRMPSQMQLLHMRMCVS